MLGSRLWRVMRRVFARAADVTQADHPVAAEKLRRARVRTGSLSRGPHPFVCQINAGIPCI